METRPTALDRHKQSRLFGGERKRTSRDSSENRLEYSQRPSRKDPRNTDVRDRRYEVYCCFIQRFFIDGTTNYDDHVNMEVLF